MISKFQVWGKSPPRNILESADNENDDSQNSSNEKKSKKSKKDKKNSKKSKKSKKPKKSKKKKSKRKRKSSSSSSSSKDEESGEEWVEKELLPRIGNEGRLKTEDSDNEDGAIGPQLPNRVTLTHKELGAALLPGK